MGWIQQNDANWKVPYKGGWCLKYVQDAFKAPHIYPSASASWKANYGNGNHPGELPPVGKTVAVYFSLGNVPEGHVAISLDDGCVASSTQGGNHPQGFIHPNLNNLINMYAKYNGGCTYLGWSEYAGPMKVLVNEIVEQSVFTTPIPFEKIRQPDAELFVGQEDVFQGGKDGIRTVTYNIVKHDGVEVSRSVASDVTTPATPEITHYGTKPVPVPEPLPEPVVPEPIKPPVIDNSFIIKAIRFIIKLIKLIIGAK